MPTDLILQVPLFVEPRVFPMLPLHLSLKVTFTPNTMHLEFNQPQKNESL